MASKTKIYTKTGDKGQTRLVDGSCVEKFNPRVEAYGTVDELNSQLGEVRLRAKSSSVDGLVVELDQLLERIQRELFQVGSLLACRQEALAAKLPALTPEHTEALEREIDKWDAELAPLSNFILPAGHAVAVALHVARTQCRRAERRVAEIEATDAWTANSLIYLNRLSDWLFTAARWSNARTGTADVPWTRA